MPIRLLRAVNWLIAAYCVFIMTLLFWPLSGWGLALIGFLVWKYRRPPRRTELGSARWAEASDLRSAGLLGASSGLILGRLPRPHRDWLGRRSMVRAGDPLVRLPEVPHCAVIAPTGSGKTVSLVIPELRTNPGSLFVLDFKGELAKNAAEYRRKRFGHRVALIDPFHMVTKHPDTYNPFDGVLASSPTALDDCADLAAATVFRTGQERERHWDDLAESCITAFAATVVTYGESDTRTFAHVRELLSHPKSFDMSLQLMIESDAWGGALARLGGQLMHLEGKEKSGVISSTLRHLRFVGTPMVAASMASSSFDAAALREGKLTVFCILPPDRATALSGLIRMWVSSFIRVCVRGGLNERRHVHAG